MYCSYFDTELYKYKTVSWDSKFPPPRTSAILLWESSPYVSLSHNKQKVDFHNRQVNFYLEFSSGNMMISKILGYCKIFYIHVSLHIHVVYILVHVKIESSKPRDILQSRKVLSHAKNTIKFLIESIIQMFLIAMNLARLF